MPLIDTDIAIVGAGIAGIATAYYLADKHGRRDLVLLDAGQPMGLTTAQSGENYRDWWPHPTMVAFTGHSIGRMEQIACDTDNAIHLTRRGYLLATRRGTTQALVEQLLAGYGSDAGERVRLHDADRGDYEAPSSVPWERAPGGIDVIANRALIARHFPGLDPDVSTLLHLRRAGDLSAQQLGQYMLDRIKALGGRLRRVCLRAIENDGAFELVLSEGEGNGGESGRIRCRTLVNAAGPFLNRVAGMLDVALPVENLLQQKIAFEDRAGVVQRQTPFTVDLDSQCLDWNSEERDLLAGSEQTSWLTRALPGGIHCRPEGGQQGTWVKLGWAYNQTASAPHREPPLDAYFPDVVLRGAAALRPGLRAYYGRLPRPFAHYSGYYTMTRDNWPLVGPLGVKGSFVVGALSGFGTMAACAAGELCADWVADAPLPDYAQDLSLARYRNKTLMAELAAMASRGVL